jgi:hypothetical protein
MVGKQNSVTAGFPRAFGEKFMACVAGGGFHRFTTFLHFPLHIRTPGFTGERKLRCQIFHKTGIGRGRTPAQLVIQMTNHKIPEPRSDEQMEQGHRIRAAGNANQISLAPAGLLKPGNVRINFHMNASGGS